MKPVLAATLHNPNSEMLAYVQNSISLQKKLFSTFNVVATKTSNRKLLDYLKKQRFNLKTVTPKPGGSSHHRKLAVKMAIENSAKANFVLHIDYDRLLHWIKSHPEELERFLKTHPKNFDFHSVGRTKRAFLTHPKIQQETEGWTNQELEKLLKLELDTPSGCFLLSNKMAKLIVKIAHEDKLLSATDGEWPALALVNYLKIGRIDVEGLEFETPDFNKEEIKEEGSYQKWLKKYYENPQVKKFRWEIAKETVKAAKETISQDLGR